MIRIIAGTKKRKKLSVPASARPITDRIKTSIFDLIKDYIANSEVLDLFSGSGNFAFESLSRGAKKAVIVEIEPKAITCIKNNIIECGYKLQTDVIKADVYTYLKKEEPDFDIIMLDPPFKVPSSNKLRLALLSSARLKEGGILIFRYPAQENYTIDTANVEIVYTKLYGASKVSFIVKKH